MKKNIIITIVAVILIIVLCVFVDKIILKTKEVKNLEIIDINLSSRVDESLNYKYEDYFTVGWLQVQGTNIDVPIFTPMLPIKEDKELVSVDFSYGWRSSSYIDGENRESLIGHNILNLSSNPMTNDELLTDFEDLMSFVYYDFAKENLYIKYTKDGKEEIYVIYAAGFYNYSEENGDSIKEKEEIKNYIEEVKERSIYDYNIEVNQNDTLISVITCTRFFGLNDKNQFKLDARKLRDDEKTYLYEVNLNDNYDEIEEKLVTQIG